MLASRYDPSSEAVVLESWAEGSGVKGARVGRVAGAVTGGGVAQGRWSRCRLYPRLVEVGVIGGVHVDAEEVDAVEKLIVHGL